MITSLVGFLGLFSNFSIHFIVIMFSLYLVNVGMNLILMPSLVMTCLMVVVFLVVSFMGFSLASSSNFLIVMSMVFSLVLFNTWSIIVFFIMFELTVVAMSILIVMCGSSYNKISSMFYLMFYTIGFSLMFLVGIVLIFVDLGSMSILISGLESVKSYFVSVLVALVMLVSMPLMLVHVWLPSAHVDSPVVGSIVLAGVMLKMGGYGLIVMLNQIDFLGFYFSGLLWWWAFLSGIFMVYFCLVEADLKSIIAYSSVAHMSLMCMAVLTLSLFGVKSSVMIMVSHGIISSMMFWSMGSIYESGKTRNMNSLWGVGLVSWGGSWMMILSLLFNMGLPPMISFWGEFIFLSSMVVKSEIIFVFLISIVILYGTFNIYNNSKVNLKSTFNILGSSSVETVTDKLQFFLMLMFFYFITVKLWLF